MTKEIELIVKSLKTKNSYGYNEISTKILKNKLPVHKLTSKLNM